MNITDITITFNERQNSEERLCGFATVIFDDCFAIRDIKIISGDNGLFLSMPSKKKRRRCETCHGRTPIDARYCGGCGAKQPPASDERGYEDIAFPITSAFREYLTKTVLQAYRKELIAAARQAAISQPVKTVA